MESYFHLNLFLTLFLYGYDFNILVIHHMYLLSILLSFFLFNFCYAEESAFYSEKEFANVEVTEIILKNGMRVYLKPTNFEEDEILIQLTAPGGFSIYGTQNRASAEIADTVALDSGFGAYNGDQLHALLYDYSFEFAPQIRPFSRIIEGTAGEESIELFLKLVNQLFTAPHFERSVFSKVVLDTKQIIRSRSYNAMLEFESTHTCLNTDGLSPLRPLTLADMEKANFEQSRNIFKKSYDNPGEFVCVIVGNFEVEKIKGLIKTYLASIPETTTKSEEPSPLIPPFPKGITTKVSLPDPHKETLVRMTFPIQEDLNEENMHDLDLATQLLSSRLRSTIKKAIGDSCGIDVGYEMPLHPSPKPVWLVIKFTANQKRTTDIKKIILDEFTHLQSHELPAHEIHSIWKEQKAADALWMIENAYWLGTLTNYAMWGWSPAHLHKIEYHSSPKHIRKVFNSFFNRKNYTLISRTLKD